jgi:hypothetical protein
LKSRLVASVVFGVLALPVLAAVWGVCWFVTQDGAAHLYNSHIWGELLKGNPAVVGHYALRPYLVPNMAGQLMLAGLLSFLTPRAADRLMMTATFVGFAGSLVWLRWKVCGREGMRWAVPLAAVVSLSWLWLLGFYNFLLGACLFPVTLGLWWGWRERLSAWRVLCIAALLVVCYFSHLVAAGLTAGGLLVLALATVEAGRLRRVVATGASLLPLGALGLAYRGVMQGTGVPIRPHWQGLADPWSPREWLVRLLQEDDVLQLHHRGYFPFVAEPSAIFSYLRPSSFVVTGLALLLAATLYAYKRERSGGTNSRRAWGVLALVFCAAGLFGPDHFGVAHGLGLRERFMLLGLACFVPFLRFESSSLAARVGVLTLFAASLLQAASVWDYALASDREVGNFMRAEAHVGRGRRVATVMALRPSRFRVVPLYNLDTLLGVGTGNVIWNNYQAGSYLFPVTYRADEEARLGERVAATNRLNLATSPEDFGAQLDGWAQVLARYEREMDVLIVWGRAEQLDEINRKWFGPDPAFEDGDVRVFMHR